MKIKSGHISVSNKKKNALPKSKLLKPKKLKPSAKTLNNKNIVGFKKEKLQLAINRAELTSSSTKVKKDTLKNHKSAKDLERIDTIGKVKPALKAKVFKPSPVISKRQDTGIEGLSADNVENQQNKKKSPKTDSDESATNVKADPIEEDGPFAKKQLNLDKVTSAVTALLKLVKGDKPGLLDLSEPIFMEVECIKIPVCPTKQLRFKLPHPLLDELSDVLLITADKKGAKIYPGKALAHYTELLAKHDINFIQKVIPLRSLREEYQQYEMRRRLVDQYDLILADANIIKSLPAKLGKMILYKRKMPIPVHLNRSNLKQHLLMAVSKTQMTVKGTGHLTIVQVGHTKMAAGEVAANILEVARSLDSVFPGGWKNIRCLDIKTGKSIPLPVYFSRAPANSVKTPVERPKVPEPVEGELSTMLGAKVVVKADGTVRSKRVAEPTPVYDSEDDEILEEAKKYIQSRKTVRHDESDDSDQAEAVTTAVEKKLLHNYNLAKKNKEDSNKGDSNKGDDEEEGEEEEESSDEEEPVVPLLGNKRKKELVKKKEAEMTPNKKQKKVDQQGKLKEKTQQEIQEGEKSGPMKKGVQRRGSRAGKKKKMNKDQRKAMLKRKKAGKK